MSSDTERSEVDQERLVTRLRAENERLKAMLMDAGIEPKGPRDPWKGITNNIHMVSTWPGVIKMKKERAAEILEEARKLGCEVGLTNFGVSYMPPLPPDLLIDAAKHANEIAEIVRTEARNEKISEPAGADGGNEKQGGLGRSKGSPASSG